MRYIVGIDLGTTNCALAYVDTEHPSLPLQLFPIPQLIMAGRVESLPTLPSFCYLVAPSEWAPGALKLPWKEELSTFVGQLAKVQGARVPTRSIQSAKSWLCHVAANRRDKILPVEAADLSMRLSPVEASSRYLIHLKEAWNASMAKGDPSLELEEQEIVLTVPASFDEVARSLTVEAAREAGFVHLTLLEEPQAAFYSWISQHEKEWKTKFKKGESVLVCDVGGGTTDFSLIEIQEQGESLSFQRLAVGDHLLLGGDNMDVALAHYMEGQLQNQGQDALESHQWNALIAAVRSAKEILLAGELREEDSYPIVLQGTGSSVVKGSLSFMLQRQEIESLLLEGFFRYHPLSEALQLKRSRGFRTMGLPYEDEPSITKHLAHFLQQAGYLEKGKGIDYLLFNGGALKPESFQRALEKTLSHWFPQTPVQRLASVSLDLAVARGAAYYGKVRRGLGVAIGGGLPRSYYLKIDTKDSSGHMASKALTLLQRGSEEGHSFQPDTIFHLRSNTPVSFHLLTSHVRLNDREGDLIEMDATEMQPLPPIQTILCFGRGQAESEKELPILPVKLGIRLTPLGIVELWLQSQISTHQWELEFQLRSATGQDAWSSLSSKNVQGERFEQGYLEEAKKIIEALFLGESSFKPKEIVERLEKGIGLSKENWGTGLLRELGGSLLKGAPKRKRSSEHEARWWNLAGFFLRPGYGYPLDDFRIKELWKIILADWKSPKTADCLIQLWICLRRVAGGLNKGQQVQLANEWLPTLWDSKSRKIEIKRQADAYPYSEKIRFLASLERLDLPTKIRLGDALVERLLHAPLACDYWALGRIGARHLMEGSIGYVVPKEKCAQWIERLLGHVPLLKQKEKMIPLFAQLARKTDRRELNLPDPIIRQILAIYPDEFLKERLLEEHRLTKEEEEEIFGESLPAGLMLYQEHS